jgi:hypothetical protein
MVDENSQAGTSNITRTLEMALYPLTSSSPPNTFDNNFNYKFNYFQFNYSQRLTAAAAAAAVLNVLPLYLILLSLTQQQRSLFDLSQRV